MMATTKVPFTKLGLTKNVEVKEVEWKDQKIEVKQYLPIQDKLKVIEHILNLTADDMNFYSPCKIMIYQAIEVILAYTNITVTDKQKADLYKLFDLFVSSGFYGAVMAAIPQTEYQVINDSIWENIKAIYDFKNSAMGVVEALKTNYDNIDFDVEALQDKIRDKDNLKLVKDILHNLDTTGEILTLGTND